MSLILSTYHCIKHNVLGSSAFFLALLFLFVPHAHAATVTWDGGGADSNCSTAGNWNSDSIPTSSDDIVFDATSTKNYVWDSSCPATINSFLQNTGYIGSGTIATTYGATFPIFTVTGNFSILAGRLQHTDNSTVETYRLRVNVGGNVTVGSGAAIQVDRLGYNGNSGPGFGYNGSHGGLGGDYTGGTYGSFLAPTNLGSGGNGGQGGGAVQLAVSGTTLVYGSITAGADIANRVGAGGSVFITTGTISGAGTVSANGGSRLPSPQSDPGGGGGRVAIVLIGSSADFANFSGVITAFGGTSNSIDGGAGTVYKEAQTDGSGEGNLVIDNNNHTISAASTTSIPAGQTWTIYQLTLQNKGVISVGSGESLILVNDNIVSDTDNRNSGIQLSGGIFTPQEGQLTIDEWSLIADDGSVTGNVIVASGGIITHSDNSTAATYRMQLTIDGNLEVQSGGAVTGNCRGFDSGQGNGGPGHGGRAGDALSSNTYGSIKAPTTLGSGGGTGCGGGAIQLTVTGDTVMNGLVDVGAYQASSRPGAAGSIYITTNTLSGTGTIQANGGIHTSSTWGGGGGGRIALVLTGAGANFSLFTGSITAYGGDEGAKSGSAGTIYLQQGNETSEEGMIIIDNEDLNTSTCTALNDLAGTGVSIASLIARNYGCFLVDTGDFLTLIGTGNSLTITSGTQFTNSGTLTISGTGAAVGGTFATDESSNVFYIGQSNNAGVTLIGTSYGNLALNNSGTTFTMPANITATTLSVSGGILNLAGKNLTVSSTFRVLTGALMLHGDETVTIPTLETGSTVIYNGTGAYSSFLLGDTYHHLSLSGAGTWSLDAALDVNGQLTLSGGTLRQQNNNITIAGDFTLNDNVTFVANANQTITLDGNLTLTDNSTIKQNLGHLIIGASPDTIDLGSDITVTTLEIGTGDTLNTHGYDITVGTGGVIIYGTLNATDDSEGDRTTITNQGNWDIKNNATYTHGSGSLILTGVNQSLLGSSKFYTLAKTNITGLEQILTLSSGKEQTLSGSLTLSNLTLNATVSGSATILTLASTATQSLTAITVSDNNAQFGASMNCTNSCTNAGNTANWTFPQSGGAAARLARTRHQKTQGTSHSNVQSPSLADVGIFRSSHSTPLNGTGSLLQSTPASDALQDDKVLSYEFDTPPTQSLRQSAFINRVCRRVDSLLKDRPLWVRQALFPRISARLIIRWGFECE